MKFYKLAWDAVGSEFGSRHTQYEMFYAGATFVTKGPLVPHLRLGRRPTGSCEQMLDSYDIDSMSARPMAA